MMNEKKTENEKIMINIEARTCPACKEQFALNLIQEVTDGIDTFTCPNCKSILEAIYDD